MDINIKYSPNFSRKSRKNKDIKALVIHYTGMQSEIASIKRLTNPLCKVSCHYLINRKGRIFKMVNDNKIAWHAGKSKWRKFTNLNKNSIGIELVNRGHRYGYQKFSKKQIHALIKICLYLKKKYRIDSSNILGHSDIAPNRKQDPGEKFPWAMLGKRGLGIWHKPTKSKFFEKNEKKFFKSFFKNLSNIGYRYFDSSKRTKNNIYVVKAFQRRFLPKNITGKIDQKTYIISHSLAKKYKN